MGLYYDKKTGVPQLLAQIRGNAKEDKDVAKATSQQGVPFNYKNWTLVAQKSHITPLQALDELGNSIGMTPPEMVFGNNQLLVVHKPTGFALSFMAVEALSCCHFKPGNDVQQLKVSVARDQSSMDDVKELQITYDWTFTSDYKGTLGRIDADGEFDSNEDAVRVEETQERIDFEKLKIREEILWMDEVNLYEDELHDHGLSIYSIRMRVMPTGFYILARYWMRLDNVIIRLNETRIHHLFHSNYMLREYTSKEISFDQLFAQGEPTHMSNYNNIDTFQHLLPTKYFQYEKIYINK